ncbi:hypothetical protein J4573_41625 [Actinomadura barringtoniae]|uniref:Uncharacterized protein n=1 Tax=Actinomadura barringtoniae TaxID=1427535 RepID=A0A939PP55_9ACTN|nr:hypothetical protein [Actinomadura barringtoniae]MBO2453648.1 hypothetical protein [Actinomadura barringtoniae]
MSRNSADYYRQMAEAAEQEASEFREALPKAKRDPRIHREVIEQAPGWIRDLDAEAKRWREKEKKARRWGR